MHLASILSVEVAVILLFVFSSTLVRGRYDLTSLVFNSLLFVFAAKRCLHLTTESSIFPSFAYLSPYYFSSKTEA